MTYRHAGQFTRYKCNQQVHPSSFRLLLKEGKSCFAASRGKPSYKAYPVEVWLNASLTQIKLRYPCEETKRFVTVELKYQRQYYRDGIRRYVPSYITTQLYGIAKLLCKRLKPTNDEIVYGKFNVGIPNITFGEYLVLGSAHRIFITPIQGETT